MNGLTKQNSIVQWHVLEVHVLSHGPHLKVRAQRRPVAPFHCSSSCGDVKCLREIEEAQSAQQERRSHQKSESMRANISKVVDAHSYHTNSVSAVFATDCLPVGQQQH